MSIGTMPSKDCDMSNNLLDNIKLQFEKFLSLVGTVLRHEKDISFVQNKLRRHFNITSSTYLSSTEFHSLLHRIHSLFDANDKSVKHFTLLASLAEQLKKYTIKSSGLNRPTDTLASESTIPIPLTTEPGLLENPCESSTIHDSIPCPATSSNEENIPTLVVERLLDVCSEINIELEQCLSSRITTDLPDVSACGKEHEKKIHKLERRLTRLSKVIRELEEKDMSLEEMEHCDLYVVESNLKKQACEVHMKLTQLKTESISLERILYRPVTLSHVEIGQPLITKALEKLVNEAKFFPSFTDVLETVETINQQSNLQLNADARKQLAEKSFKIIGKQMKNRRMSDFHDIMKSRLPEHFDIEKNDPALHNAEMQKALLENERQARIKTEEIFEEFSQIDPDLETVVDIESSEASSIESDDEKEESESDNKPDEPQYDIIDILPAFVSEPTSPAAAPVIVESTTTSIMNRDLFADIPEISLNNHTFTVLSTASLPLKRSLRYSSESNTPKPDTCATFDGDHPQSSSPVDIFPEQHVQTLIPRRREHLSNNDMIYNLYQRRLSKTNPSVGQKRSLSKATDCVRKKKSKQPELVILD